jgi:membrane protein
MATTLVGLYPTTTAAEEVMQDLVAHGFPRGELHYPPQATNGHRTVKNSHLPQRLVAQGVPGDDASLYAEGVNHGGALVVVQTSNDAAGRGLSILNQRHPVKLHERHLPWQQEDWERVSTPAPGQRQKKGFLGGLKIVDLAKRVIHEIQQDNCAGRAAQLAYYLIFAVFPFLLFLATMIGYLPIPNLMDKIMDYLARLLPGETATLLRDNVVQLVSDQKGGLLSFGILLTLWTASSAIVAIMEALNRSYDVEEGRPFWKVRGIAVLLTIGLSLFIIGSMVLLLFGPQLGEWIASLVGLGTAFKVVWNILRWPVIVGLLSLAMAIIYYFAPDVEQRWKWITPGAVFAVVMTIAVSLGFSFYVNNFGSYNKTYGSIGAVIVFLTWLYLSGFVILAGGEINAEIEHASPEGKAPGQKIGA